MEFFNRRISIVRVCLFNCLSVTLLCLFVSWMYCLELTNLMFPTRVTSYYVQVENVAQRCTVMENDPRRSWKSHGKIFVEKSVGTVN